MKMGRRLRCSSVTYRSRYAPSTASPARTALPAAHFDRNESHVIYGTAHWRRTISQPESVICHLSFVICHSLLRRLRNGLEHLAQHTEKRKNPCRQRGIDRNFRNGDQHLDPGHLG